MSNYRNDSMGLLSALVGGAWDLSSIGAEEYLRLIKRAIVPSLFGLVAGFVLAGFSQVSGLSLFNAMAVAAFALVALMWVLLALPILFFAEVASTIEWKPVTRLLGIISSFLFVSIILVVTVFFLPSGFNSLHWVGIILSVALAFSGLGMSFSRKLLAAQMGALALFAALSLTMPGLSEGLVDSLHDADKEFGKRLSGPPTAMDITREMLTGKGAKATPIFDRAGEPYWWCRTDVNHASGFRCYNREGRDQYTNEVLVPISDGIVHQALLNFDAHDLRISAARAEEESRTRQAQEKAEIIRQEQEASRLADEREQEASRLATELEQYRLINLNLLSARQARLISIRNSHGFDSDLETQLRNELGVANLSLFRPAALSSGVFDGVVRGDSAELEKLGLNSVVGTVIVGSLSETFEPNARVAGSGKVRLALELVEIDTDKNSILWQETISAEAMGQSRDIASRNARAALQQQIKVKAQALR